MVKKLSVIIITYNEAKKIRACLESVRWADEIIIFDSLSKDATLKIAREFTDKIFQRSWSCYGEQKNIAASHAQGEWILFLDADERVSEPLVAEIKKVINNNSLPYDGYDMPRQLFYLNRLVRYGEWSVDLKLRLIRKGAGMWSQARVHEELILDGPLGHLHGPILHHSYDSIALHIKKLNRYSSLYAMDLFDCRAPFRFSQIVMLPFSRFTEGYFLNKGFLDGIIGFWVALMQSCEVFLRYVKLLILIVKHIPTGKSDKVATDIHVYRRTIKNLNTRTYEIITTQ
ncbi:MAG: glycosyltransferase family 2 protein [Candidatus Omnitrophica bacterium]|nr:glycosyltransferase family 2 protein [Candidatus Omnitrophota bacterium]